MIRVVLPDGQTIDVDGSAPDVAEGLPAGSVAFLPVPSIAQALAAAARAVGAVPKADVNEEQRFKYRGIERILAAAGPALHDAGIVTVPRVVDVWRGTMERGRDRNIWQHYVLTIEYRFVGPAGDEVVAVVVGEGLDNADKGMSKAQTMAYKTALLQVLGIGDDENDPDRSTPADGPPQARESSGSRGSRAPAKKAAAKKAPAKRAAARRADPAPAAEERPAPATPEERVAPLVEAHGPEHAARVADVLRRLDSIEPKETRKSVKEAFARAHGSPLEIAPEALPPAVDWLDEMLAGPDSADVAPEAGSGPEETASVLDVETPEQRAARLGFCASCGAMVAEGAPHEEDCPEAPF